MIDRIVGKIVFSCDVCGDQLKTDKAVFREGLAILHAAAWHSKSIDGTWRYTCPGCGLPGERAPLARDARLTGKS